MGKIYTFGRLVFGIAVLGWLVFGSSGCTRVFYRRQADREVADILREKDVYPEWKIEQMHVYADPRARFAEPNNPDRPPMPPDDDATYHVSPHPQSPGHAGVGNVYGTAYLEMIKTWDAETRAQRDAVFAQEKLAPGLSDKEKRPVQHWF